MPLECTMICLDNSEWMRNGDIAPTRLGAQQDAANMITTDRIHSNPENTVGVLAMAGKGVELLVSPTEDSTKILAAFAKVTIGGHNSFLTGLQIAQLALKHRKNKAGGQRIVAFVGSPITEDTETLTRVGKMLKKNSVAVDIISIGEVDDNNDKLSRFIEAVSSVDSDNRANSNLIVVPQGVMPTDALASSPVLHSQGGYGGGMAGSGGGGGGGGGDWGVDEALDPDLAMALRISAEESKARVQAQAQSDAPSSSSSSSSSEASAGGASGMAIDEDDEEALMQRALEMSISDTKPAAAAVASTPAASAAPVSSSSAAFDDDDEDEALRMALAMSMEVPSDAPTAASSSSSSSSSAAVPPQPPAGEMLHGLDAAALSAMLAEVTGQDSLNDPLILAALEQMRNKDAKEGEGKETKKRKDEG